MHYIAPHNQLEAAIAEILRDVLKVEQVGVEDNFFELGGNSLLLVQAQSRLQAALDREIPVFELFNNPTVRDLARFLGAGLEPPPAADDGTAAQLRVGKDRLRRRLAKAQLEPLAAPQLERHGGVGGPHQPHRPRQGGKEVA